MSEELIVEETKPSLVIELLNAKYMNPEHTLIDAEIVHKTFGNISYGIDTTTPDESLDAEIKSLLEDFEIEAYVEPEKTSEEIIASYTSLTANHIQSVIDDYNIKNGTKFDDINSLSKYLIDETYTHYQFCRQCLIWNIDVWEKARAIQEEVLAETRDLPTDEEFLEELPVFSI